MLQKSKGFSLLDLLLTVSVVFLISFIGIPSLTNTLNKYRADTIISNLKRTIQFSRDRAATHNVVITICPSTDQRECSKDWAQGIIVFYDHDLNKKVSAKEKILHYQPPIPDEYNLKWRSFQNKAYIQYSPLGYTLSHNGSFTLCPENGNLEFARLLILNKAGRVRQGMDTDGDGIQEKPSGKPVECK